ncbi:MAG TPA: ANTAR domain-containing protein [Mycobacterium sp.]
MPTTSATLPVAIMPTVPAFIAVTVAVVPACAAAWVAWAPARVAAPRDDLVLDGHLRQDDRHRVTSELREVSVVQQAVGLLIDRGRTPQAARDELEHASAESATPVHDVAAHVIRDARSTDPSA